IDCYVKLNDWYNAFKFACSERESENDILIRNGFEAANKLISNNLPVNLSLNPDAIYTSRLLDFKYLPEPRNSYTLETRENPNFNSNNRKEPLKDFTRSLSIVPDNEFAQKSESLYLIELTEPDITINNNSNSKVWNNINSNFASVHASVAQKTADTERLLSLLIKQKDNIDKILDSQPVCALGPDFQQGHSVPCIACWVTMPLDMVIVEQLSALFDNEFEIIIHIVEEQYKSLNNGNNGNKTNRKNENNEKSKVNGEKDDDDRNRIIKCSYVDNPFMQVQSVAYVEFENILQTFTINAYIRANIITMNRVSRNLLEFSINLSQCETGKMLSEICESFQGIIGYYLDSILIKVSPIFYNEDAINVIDTGFNGQIGTTGLTASSNKKYRNITETSNWQMDLNFCANTGVRWSYQYNFNGTDRKWQNSHTHIGHWYLSDEMKGFRITITQILCHKFNSYFFLCGKKPEIIKKCPKIFHNLEISFTDMANFNENFEKLAKKVHRT
ncbi:24822_t:CDS:2, partial [Dentiscutata erythropus]